MVSVRLRTVESTLMSQQIGYFILNFFSELQKGRSFWKDGVVNFVFLIISWGFVYGLQKRRMFNNLPNFL